MESVIPSTSIQTFKSPFGELILGSYKNQLILCDWKHRKQRNSIDKRIKTLLNSEFKNENSKIIEDTKKQLTEYFKGERKNFSLDFRLLGTPFQQKVWLELTKIPFGKFKSYAELANDLNNLKAIRAIASANGANALSMIVPCHRIIGSDGSLVGYAGGLTAKRKLLQLSWESMSTHYWKPQAFCWSCFRKN